MLTITIPASEFFDERTNEFISYKEQTLQLEHSLVSLSKWESKWCKPFLTDTDKTTEETIDYIKCMTITQNVNPTVYNFLSKDNIDAITKYIDAPMTATTFPYEEKRNSRNGETTTSELIYYWMVSFNIPMECQKWHLNRLLTLIRVCNVKNTPPKKMSKRDIISRNAALNAKRKQQLNTKG